MVKVHKCKECQQTFLSWKEFDAHVGQRELSPMSRLRRNHDTSNACKLGIWLHSSVLEERQSSRTFF